MISSKPRIIASVMNDSKRYFSVGIIILIYLFTNIYYIFIFDKII
jgi:hypothetical protein